MEVIDAPIDVIQSNFPHDLTGYVTKSDHPSASGSYGDIYRGKLNTRGDSIDIAIKTYRLYLDSEHDIPSDKKLKRFRRELTVWLNLKHPNILRLLGTIRDASMRSDIPAMVCPWVENGALSTHLERNKDLAVEKRLILIDGVARGLHYLHSQHIVHGDLSGSNVLVKADGSACIADFGLSMLLTQIGGPTFVTTHQAKGTTRWMAPELLGLDDSELTPTMQSDVYSFGSIVLQILTGNIPYYHLPRDEQVLFAIVKGTRPTRPDGGAVTEQRWKFIEWCWSPVEDDKLARPTSDEIVGFAEEQLTEVQLCGRNNVANATSGEADTLGEQAAKKLEALISARDLTGCVKLSEGNPFASSDFGDVIYKGRLNKEGKSIKVAIKTFRLYMNNEAPLAKRKTMCRHFTVWFSLKHPNVLPWLGIVTDVDAGSFLPALVCPWIEDDNLTVYLGKNKDLTNPQRLALVDDVACGLQYLHSQGVVHGDLSGSNVLVQTNGRACIANFGLLILFTKLEGRILFTSRRIRGAVRWAAPEAFLFDESVATPSTQGDVYSFGSIMLQIFTGDIPYYYIQGETQVILAIVTGEKHRRPDQTVVTDDRWDFMEWCWPPIDADRLRPTSDQIVEYTQGGFVAATA